MPKIVELDKSPPNGGAKAYGTGGRVDGKSDRKQWRSQRWFAPDDLRSFGHRSRMKQLGYWRAEFADRPVIGILNTWNELNTCHSHFPERVDDIKRGVLIGGGFPVELPVMSLGEQLLKPTAMLFRNLLAMEAEELVRGYPVDGVVLMGGCDKTTPALLMAAASLDLPAIYVPAGPMLRGNWRGGTLGSGSDVWKYWDERRAGNISDETWSELEDGIARSPGTCMTMGTAATMMSLAEAMGMTLAGASSIPAVDSNHKRMASASGARVVEMVREDLRPSAILTRAAIENAVRVDAAIGGSTNAVVHLLAIAGRAGVDLRLDDFNTLAGDIPLLANVRPSGQFLMEDFYYAGGLRALMARLASRLDLDAMTVSGRPLRDQLVHAEVFKREVIRSLDEPVERDGGLAVLRGNLAPNGAVIKPTAAERRLHAHCGAAVVFESIHDMKARVDADDLAVTPESVLVLKNAGPVGGPGMPEWGQLPIPRKLLKQGVRDMVRISDARMSGTSYGCCVLHVAPEAFVGGPLALVRDGDMIELDIAAHRLQLNVSENELASRRSAWRPPQRGMPQGYAALYAQHVLQADQGCDFDFLRGTRRSLEPEIF